MADQTEDFYSHGLVRMTGRNKGQHGRVSSPLELLFDLAFAGTFGVLGVQLSHGVVEGHAGLAVLAFLFGGVAVVWAWINYTWFASAFDTDDWLFRLLTMVQMTGVIVLAIGLPAMFDSVTHGGEFNNRVMVSGYIVMRVAMLCQWLRAARAPEFRVAAHTYIFFIGIAQIGWIVVAWAPLTIGWAFACALLCWSVELLGPLLAERRGERSGGDGTPWHPHHIAERYSLLTIVTLGETVIGTIAAAQSITGERGWHLESIVVIGAGIAMTFALWWTYFLMPSAPILATHRQRSFGWGYAHAFIFLAVAAVGASLHLIGYAYDPEVALPTATVMAFLAGSVVVYGLTIAVIDSWLVRGPVFHPLLQIIMVGLPVIGFLLSLANMPLWFCLVIVLAGPVTAVVSYEAGGWRRIDAQLRRAIADAPQS